MIYHGMEATTDLPNFSGPVEMAAPAIGGISTLGIRHLLAADIAMH